MNKTSKKIQAQATTLKYAKPTTYAATNRKALRPNCKRECAVKGTAETYLSEGKPDPNLKGNSMIKQAKAVLGVSDRLSTPWQLVYGFVIAASLTLSERVVAAGLDSISSNTLQYDSLVTVGALLASVTVVKFFDTLADKGLVEQNLSRKLIHISCGPLLVVSWLFYSDALSAQYLSAIIPIVNGLRLLLIGTGLFENEAAIKAVSRKGDKSELLRGPLYYTIVLAVVNLFFWRNSATSVVTLSIMCGGDGLADVIGRRFGVKNKLFYNAEKSWAGSIAMVSGSLILAQMLFFIYGQFGLLSNSPDLIWKLLFICITAALVESLPITDIIDDNISVPVVSITLANLLL